MKEEDYVERLLIAERWLMTARQLFQKGDYEYGYGKLISARNEIESIINHMNKKPKN